MAGWPFFIFIAIGATLVYNCRKSNPKRYIFGVSTKRTLSSLIGASYSDSFRHPSLTDKEHNDGTRLGIDSFADTSCAGKFAFVEEFIEGKTVSASGFAPSIGSLTGLPIVNVVYAYDTVDGNVILLESNNAIYMGNKMEDSLLNPIQAEEAGVRVDIRPRQYYPEDVSCQSLTFPDGTIIPVIYDGVLPYVPVRRPTKEEVQFCRRLALSDRNAWDPFMMSGEFCRVNADLDTVNMTDIVDQLEAYDPVASELMSTQLSTILSLESMIHEVDDEVYHSTIAAINSKANQTISPEELSKRLHIGLKTAAHTLNATTHQWIRTTGLLTKRFRTDKAHLRYNQLSFSFSFSECFFDWRLTM